jgi:hypothetical protein
VTRAGTPNLATQPPRKASATVAAATDDSHLLDRMRARQKAGDVPGLLSATRLYLNSDLARAERATAVAREFFDAGDADSAARVIREVLQEVPGFPPAERLRGQLP